METQQTISQDRDTKSDKQKTGDKSAFAIFISKIKGVVVELNPQLWSKSK